MWPAEPGPEGKQGPKLQQPAGIVRYTRKRSSQILGVLLQVKCLAHSTANAQAEAADCAHQAQEGF